MQMKPRKPVFVQYLYSHIIGLDTQRSGIRRRGQKEKTTCSPRLKPIKCLLPHKITNVSLYNLPRDKNKHPFFSCRPTSTLYHQGTSLATKLYNLDDIQQVIRSSTSSV